eukprot:scaffold375_cov378-Prasinococcus_capsulatus_cf.AAC.36
MTTRTSLKPCLASRSPRTCRLDASAKHQASEAMTRCFFTLASAWSVARTSVMLARASAVVMRGCCMSRTSRRTLGKWACAFVLSLYPFTVSHSYPSSCRSRPFLVLRLWSCFSKVVEPVLWGPTKSRHVLL